MRKLILIFMISLLSVTAGAQEWISNGESGYSVRQKLNSLKGTVNTLVDKVDTTLSWFDTTTHIATAYDLSQVSGGTQTITLTTDVTGSGVGTITATVTDDSHNHIIANVDNLQDTIDRHTDTTQAHNDRINLNLDSITAHNLRIIKNADTGIAQRTDINALAAPKYIVQQASATLVNEQAMGALATGLVKNTTTTGVQSIAVAGTDYVPDYPGAGVPLSTGSAWGTSYATGYFMENVTGLELSGSPRRLLEGGTTLGLTTGYVIPTTTEQTNWNKTYDTVNNERYIPKWLIDAEGDLIIGDANNVPKIFPMGTALQVIRVNSGGTALEYADPSSVTPANVTVGSNKITLGGTPTGAALQAFSIDVDETNINHNNLLNYTARRHYTQPEIDTINDALTGLLKVASGVLAQAVSGIDYQAPITPTNVTAGSSKISLGGTPTGAALQAFSVDVAEGNINHNALLNYTARRHYTQPEIDTINDALTGLLKAASGVLAQAVSGTDYDPSIINELDSIYVDYVNGASGRSDEWIRNDTIVVDTSTVNDSIFVLYTGDNTGRANEWIKNDTIVVDTNIGYWRLAGGDNNNSWISTMDTANGKPISVFQATRTFVVNRHTGVSYAALVSWAFRVGGYSIFDSTIILNEVVTKPSTPAYALVLSATGDSVQKYAWPAGGGGTVTSIAQGTGMLNSVDPITTTGTVGVDTTKVVMFNDTAGTGATGKIETKYHATTTFEPIVTGGTTSQYWRGDKTWQTTPLGVTAGDTTGEMAYWDGDSWEPAFGAKLKWDATNKRLGIGKYAPIARLDVVEAGNTAISGVTSGSGNYTGIYGESTGAGGDEISVGISAKAEPAVNGSAYAVHAESDSASGYGVYAKSTNGTALYADGETNLMGNVGISTTSPATPLHTELIAAASGTSNHIATFGRAGSAVAAVIGYNETNTRMYLGTSTGHDLGIRVNNTNAMFIESTNGYIGLGSVNPYTKFWLQDGGFTLADNDVAHGMSSYFQEKTYGSIGVISGTAGGLNIYGISDSDAAPFRITSVLGSATPTTTIPGIDLRAYKKNGTSIQALGSTETVLQILNGTTSLVTVLGSGNVGIGETSSTADLHIKHAGAVSTTAGIILENTTVNEEYLLCPGINGSTSSGFSIYDKNNSANRFSISSAGVVTIYNLSGTGSRSVIADANGVLSAPTSDARLKKNTTPIKADWLGMLKDKRIKGINFQWKDESKGDYFELGFTSQMFEPYKISGLTFEDKGIKGLNYDKICVVLWEQNKALLEKVESLEERVERLEKLIK